MTTQKTEEARGYCGPLQVFFQSASWFFNIEEERLSTCLSTCQSRIVKIQWVCLKKIIQIQYSCLLWQKENNENLEISPYSRYKKCLSKLCDSHTLEMWAIIKMQWVRANRSHPELCPGLIYQLDIHPSRPHTDTLCCGFHHTHQKGQHSPVFLARIWLWSGHELWCHVRWTAFMVQCCIEEWVLCFVLPGSQLPG